MMYIHEAILKAQKEKKEIALPNNEHCDNDGYQIRAKPFPNNLVVNEFYGNKRILNQFPLTPNELIRDDWIVI